MIIIRIKWRFEAKLIRNWDVGQVGWANYMRQRINNYSYWVKAEIFSLSVQGDSHIYTPNIIIFIHVLTFYFALSLALLLLLPAYCAWHVPFTWWDSW